MSGQSVARICASALLISAGSMVADPAAAAQHEDRWYVAAAGTVSLLEDAHSLVTGLPIPGGFTEHEHRMDAGYGLQAALARRLGRLRVEAELGYTHNDSDGYVAIVPPNGRIRSDGRHDALRLMANAYVDFGQGRLRPYLGAGAGWTQVKMRFFGPRPPFPTEDPMLILDSKDSGFAWQAIAGAALQVTASLAVTAQYRWFDAGTLKAPDLSDIPHQREHAGHNIDLGIRFAF